jgi:hypothetical protein
VKAHRVGRRRGSHILSDNRLTDGGKIISPPLRPPWYSFLLEAMTDKLVLLPRSELTTCGQQPLAHFLPTRKQLGYFNPVHKHILDVALSH